MTNHKTKNITNINNVSNIAMLNQATDEQATNLLQQCCTSNKWVKILVAQRPFTSIEQLHSHADKLWQTLDESDYLQAFDGHPKIGDVNSLKAKYANTKVVASGEQSSVEQASDDTIQQLSQGNNEYLKKFGFIFIVCATGKSAQQMLNLLQARDPNDRKTELQNAANEQAKIFHLRIDKLLTNTKI